MLLSVAVAPAVFLLLFVYLRDKYEHEPLGLVGLTFVLGAVGMIPATVIELGFASFFSFGLIGLFECAAIVEEVIKFGAVRIRAYSSSQFNEVMDGIVYGVAAGLGFATAENIIYVLQTGLSVAIVRAFLSVPDHAVWAGIMGFYIGLAKCTSVSKDQEHRQIIKGVGIAIVLHGTYDILVFDSSFLGAIGVSLLGWILFLWMIRNALSLSPYRWRDGAITYPYGASQSALPPPRFCSRCGSRLVGDEKYCMNCSFLVSR